MTSTPHTIIPTGTMGTELFRPILRLRLKPTAPTTGSVDGAWWPRSRELNTELPGMLIALSQRLGHIARVSYDLNAWNAVQRRLIIEGRVIPIQGFRSQPAHTLGVTAYDGRRITLLVVPVETTEATAQHALMMASRSGNTDTTAALLAEWDTPPALPTPRGAPDVTTQRREDEGGHVPAPA